MTQPAYSTHSNLEQVQASDAVRVRLLEAQLAAQAGETAKWRQLARRNEHRAKRSHRRAEAIQREADALRRKFAIIQELVNEGETNGE